MLQVQHTGAERTFQRITKKYYFPGMRRFIITEYISKCQQYKATNEKPVGILQTPVYALQRFELINIYLFGPLREGEKWIFIVEDSVTKWVELLAVQNATAEKYAKTVVNEIIFKYGLPRKIISAVMQQICHIFDIKEHFITLNHPSANMVERKNRDLKPRLVILVRNPHKLWPEKLPIIRFAINTAMCESTG